MDGMLVLILIGVAVAITYFVMRSEMNQQLKRWGEEKELLEQRIDAYDKYLTKNCGYDRPFRRYNGDWLVRDPMTDELKYHMFMSDCAKYEAEHKNAKVDGCIDIGGVLYDLRESKYNELAMENYKNKEQMFDYRIRAYLCEWIFGEMERKHQKDFEKVWKKISKQLGVEDFLTSYKDITWRIPIYKEVTDVEQYVKNAERFNKGKKLPKERVAKLKKDAKEQKLRNKFVMDFNQYLDHEYCSGKRCDKKVCNTKECRRLRKRFQRYKDDDDFDY